ncbi:hypothetical protein AYI69_g11260, partial [Smittium culicis]
NHETKAELDESSSKRKHNSEEIINAPAAEDENKDEAAAQKDAVTAPEPTANEQPENAQTPSTEESNSKEDDKSPGVAETAASSTPAASAPSRVEEPTPNTNAEKITSVQPPAKKKKFMGSSNSLSSSAKRRKSVRVGVNDYGTFRFAIQRGRILPGHQVPDRLSVQAAKGELVASANHIENTAVDLLVADRREPPRSACWVDCSAVSERAQ